jgi:hypothetical protein
LVFLSAIDITFKRGFAMSEREGVTLCSIRWSEVLPWQSTLRIFRLAVTLRMLVLGATGILLTLLGWALFGWLFFATDQAGDLSTWAVIDQAVPTSHAPPILLGSLTPDEHMESGDSHRGDPFFGSWVELSRPVWQIFAARSMSLASLLCCVLSALWSLAVWAFFGGAITRIAAVQLASEEQVGWGASLRWAGSKWLSYFGAPLFPLAGVLLAVLPLAFIGLLMRWGPGLFLLGLFWPLALVGGLVMALLLIGLAFGWPLMWATISVEGTDSFDALSRAYAYVFQRPLRYLFYALVAAVLGWLGWLLVANLAAAVIWLSLWGASWGMGADRLQKILGGELDGAAGGGVALITFWAGWIKWLALGYVYAYFWTASTVIYYLLRRDVDATEMDEVFLDADQSEKQFSLPPLVSDAAGAPETAAKPQAEDAKPQAPDAGDAKPQAEG